MDLEGLESTSILLAISVTKVKLPRASRRKETVTAAVLLACYEASMHLARLTNGPLALA